MTFITFEYEGNKYTICRWLAGVLDSIAYNLEKDWDFVILVTGDRMVRTGKSVLAMLICAYLHYMFKLLKLNDNAYGISDIYFDNKEMMKKVLNKPKFSINHYDEGREGLAASKAMKEIQHDLLDFFAECGQLNHVFVIVCPDFFELKEDIAVARSELLLNVYRTENKAERNFPDGTRRPVVIFERGNFECYNRNTKAALYDIAKTTRRKSYHHVKCNFYDNFGNQYPIDETEYRRLKREALLRFKEKHEEAAKEQRNTRVYASIVRAKETGMKSREIAEIFGYNERTIRQILHDNAGKGREMCADDGKLVIKSEEKENVNEESIV